MHKQITFEFMMYMLLLLVANKKKIRLKTKKLLPPLANNTQSHRKLVKCLQKPNIKLDFKSKHLHLRRYEVTCKIIKMLKFGIHFVDCCVSIVICIDFTYMPL